MAKKAGVTRKRKTRADAPGADGAAGEGGAEIGHNSKKELTPDEKQELFLHHRTAWNEVQAKVKAAKKMETDVVAALKADGFTKKHMTIADQLADVKGEAKVKSEVEERLQVAQWLGHPMGAQMDLFMQPDRTPITDVAYQEGKRMSMQNKPLKPKYSPDTEAYRACAAGYHDHQRELAGGLRAPGDINQSGTAHRTGDEQSAAH